MSDILNKLKTLIKPTKEELELALELSAINGQLEVLKILIEEYKCDPHIEDEFGKEAILHTAVLHGDLNMVKYLIEECNCDCHIKGIILGEKEALLQSAIYKGHLNIVQYLIEECNCDPHVNKWSTWKFATRYGHKDIANYLKKIKCKKIIT